MTGMFMNQAQRIVSMLWIWDKVRLICWVAHTSGSGARMYMCMWGGGYHSRCGEPNTVRSRRCCLDTW